MDFGNPIFLFLFIEVIVVIALLAFFLRKPRLAVVPAPPHAVRRDLAYRIRSIGYPVEIAKDVLRVKVDSLAALKLRVRDDRRGGTSIQDEADATTTGCATAAS